MKSPMLRRVIPAASAILLMFNTTHAGQIAFTTPVNSPGNNFTMLASDNSIIGGTNDVIFTWDGTLNDAVAGAVSNATLTSDEAFFGSFWAAHDIMFYAPGTYTIFDGCAPGNPGCGTGNAVTFTVGPNQIGAHMLFDWPANNPPILPNADIDVVLVFSKSTTWTVENGAIGSPFFGGLDDGAACTPQGAPSPMPCVIDGLPNTGSTPFTLVSTDWDGNGVAGGAITDGPFAGSSANMNLNGANFPPVATDISTSTVVDTVKIIDLAAAASDPDGTIVPGSAAIVPASGPANGSVVNNGDGTVTYTPNPGFTSPPTDSFQYTVDDNHGATSAPATVTIAVTAAANTPPVANDTAVATDEDVALDIEVNNVATDADGDPLTFQTFDAISVGGGTAVADGSSTVLTYTPAADFHGTDSFAFNVSDGIESSNTATITVAVNSVNDPPVCTDVSLRTDLNTPLNIDVNSDLLSNCSDPDGDTISLVSTTQPVNGTLADDGAGTLTYTPNTDFQGADSFDFTATDGTAQDTATVTVGVGKLFSNFTMLDPDGVTFGGTNDIVFQWDGTCYNSVATADAGPANMVMGSDSNFPFFGFPWIAHDIKVYCPGGPYTVDTCNPGVTPPDCGPLAFTVPAGHLGGHILLDWNVTTDVDVAIVWNNSTGGTWQNVVPGGQLYLGPAGPTPAPDEFYDWISVDADGDGIPGIPIVDGPFRGFRANYNLKTTFDAGEPEELPVTIDIKPGNNSNTINPRAHGGIWVAILSDSDFDASSLVDIASVELGPAGAVATRYMVKDVDKDGLGDLLLRFEIPATGIVCGDTEATLTGYTIDEQPIVGTDSIKTVGCRK